MNREPVWHRHSCLCWARAGVSHGAPDKVEEVLQDSPRQSPDLVLLVTVEIRGIPLAAERDVTHLGLLRRQQRFERNFEYFFDLARLQHVVDAFVDDADER